MAIKITIATTAAEIDDVFKVREQVFVQEEGKFQASKEGRCFDRFDTYPTTKNLVVKTIDDEIVGTLRLTLDSEMGVPADLSYHFRDFLPQNYRLMSAGMFCVKKAYRNNKLVLGLNLMAAYYAISHNVTHIVAPINPTIAKLVQRIGFKALDKVIQDSHSGLDIVPIVLDLNDLNDLFLHFIEQNELENYLHAYECVFYDKDEYIVKKGETGDCAFVIIKGEVGVIHPHKKKDKIMDTMGAGQVFGELAILTDQQRTADIIALTNVRVMTLSSEVFKQSLLENPEKALEFMQQIGERMKYLIG